MLARRWWSTALGLVLLLVGDSAGNLKPECAPTAHCTVGEQAGSEYYYKVSDLGVVVDFKDGAWFKLSCNNIPLDHPELPRFPTSVRVNRVTLKNCTPPRNGSYMEATAALNVTSFSELVLFELPAESVITHAHLVGMQRLLRLEMYANSHVSLAPGALGALSVVPILQYLTLNQVHTPDADLARLPPTIKFLKLWYVEAVSSNFNSLPNLISLNLAENYNIAVNASKATALINLTISTPNTVVPEDALPLTLTNLILFGWNDTRPTPKTHCESLKSLKLTGTSNSKHPLLLPDEWLASCSKLEVLQIYNVPIRGALPARLLANTTALRNICIKKCNLTSLPQGFFDNTPNLIDLNLSENKLTTLPSGLFLHTKSLKILILSHNLLTGAVAQALSAASSLTKLLLNNNNIGDDICLGGYNSPVPAHPAALSNLTALQYLYLSYTNVTRICREWRQKLINLKYLELRQTAITQLTYEDLQFSVVGRASVELGNGKYELQYQPEDYKKSLTQKDIKTSIVISGSLVCDCNTYWAALAFHNNPSHSRTLAKLQCNGTPLAKVDLDRLTCSASDDCAGLQGKCTCRKREDYEHGSVVIMQCVGLTEFPRLPGSKHKWRVHLANNNISHIDAANVSTNIVELDLRNNSIKRLDGQTAAKLASVPQLQLAGNPLECGCESFEMLRALLDTSSQLRHLADVRCNGTGQPLTAVKLMPCSVQRHMPVPQLMLPLVLSLVVLLAVAVLAYGVIARPATRLWIKMFFIWIGWLPRPFEPADDDRRYDAFISFAHEDEKLVVEELAARLESGPQPYRLCLHYRDWAPGEWIPAQIAASVRASRRTVAVVSTHYLQSGWARAEFREATAASLRDGTPRLVVVLLDDPEKLTIEADSELNTYVRHNIYVRWGDPWFWEKMRQALPLPRTRHPNKAVSLHAPIQTDPNAQMNKSWEDIPTLTTNPASLINLSNTPAMLMNSCIAGSLAYVPNCREPMPNIG